MPATNYFPNSRQSIKATITSGAVDEDLAVAGSASIESIMVSYSSTPPDESVTVTVTDADGDTTHSAVFNALTESEYSGNDVGSVFEKWFTGHGGGTINVATNNTGNLITSIVAVVDYQGGK
jgi:hypothetical protein